MRWLLLLLPFTTFAQYTYTSIPHSSDLLGGVNVQLVDDAVSPAIPIGFQFCFWGNKYSQCYIGSNGWVGFTAGQPIAFTPFPIPTTNFLIPKNCIMMFHDLNPGIAGFPASPIFYVYHYLAGTAPYRRLVVSWWSVPMYQCISMRSTQQIVIYETTNVIKIHIMQKSTCMAWVNGKAILGLHSIGGANAVVVAGRNATTWNISSPEIWQFTPDSCLCKPVFGGLTVN